jgi:hypothetical protein
MRGWDKRLDRVEAIIWSNHLILRFKDGTWQGLPSGADIDLFMKLLGDERLTRGDRRTLAVIRRSVRDPDEGEILRLLRDEGSRLAARAGQR